MGVPRSSAGRACAPSGLSRDASQAEPLVPNAVRWNYTFGEQPLLNANVMILALGRYGDVYGPMPFEMVAPDAWEGNMLHASHDLAAWAEYSAASAMSAPGQDPEEGLEAKPASAAPEGETP